METKMPLDPLRSGAEWEADALLLLSKQIRQMPYLDPPVRLTPSVLKAIRHKRFPVWFRLLRWARSPRSLTFTPLQAALAASLFILVSAVGVSQLLRNDHPHLSQPTAPGMAPITLTLNMPEARSVSVVGTFNAWDDKGYEMKKDRKKGAWTLVLHLPVGHYEYAFVLDGKELIPDPRAEFYQDDGFGNQNAVLIVGNHHDRTI
jgi:hypothetical protein